MSLGFFAAIGTNSFLWRVVLLVFIIKDIRVCSYAMRGPLLCHLLLFEGLFFHPFSGSAMTQGRAKSLDDRGMGDGLSK